MKARVALIMLMLVTAFLQVRLIRNHRNMPRCQEDVVLVGVGQFENGRWEYYECGPALDDFEGDYVR